MNCNIRERNLLIKSINTLLPKRMNGAIEVSYYSGGTNKIFVIVRCDRSTNHQGSWLNTPLVQPLFASFETAQNQGHGDEKVLIIIKSIQ